MSQEREGTIARVVQVLRSLAEADEDLSISQLSAQVALPPSTVHRLLQILRSQGMVQFDPERRRYGVGSEFYRIAAQVVDKVRVPAVARPFMAQVVDQCNETCLLGMYLPAAGKMMFAAKVDSTHPVRYVIPMHTPLSLVWGASGRAILAFLPPEEIQKVLAAEEPSPATGEAVPDPQVIQRELAEVRSQGYAYTRGQKVPGAVGFAAPIFGAAGPVGDLCITIPEFRFNPEDKQKLASLIVGTAHRLSIALGWKPSSQRPRPQRR